jgi:hypothetical protein
MSMAIGTIKPEVIALSEFFNVEAPSLRIPTIQRQFVWDSDDIKDLVDSIISGYPIGAIIIWEPAADFPSVPLVGDAGGAERRRYVLDGQQRLTALMLVKDGWKIQRGQKQIQTTAISFVPESEKLFRSSKKGIDISLIVNATLGDADSLTSLHKEYPGTYKKAMEIIGQRIVNYKLPFYVLKTDAPVGDNVYERIADIFTRVNSAGVKIGNLEMFLSFFAAAFPRKEKDRIIEMHEKLSERFELDLEPLVRFVFSRMGLSQNQITKVTSFQKAIKTLKERYSKGKNEVPNILARCESAVNTVLDLLDKNLGQSTTQYMPSQNALLPLFDAAYENEYDKPSSVPGREADRMLYWFIVASFNGFYSSSPNYKIDEDLEVIRANRKKFPVDELLECAKKRPPHLSRVRKEDIVENSYTNVLRGRVGKEYLMLLDILLYRNQATNWAGKPIVSEREQVHHIFPREFLKQAGELRDDMINCIGNLTLIDPDTNKEIGDDPPAEYLPERTDETTRLHHFIPEDKKLWNIENYEKSLDARVKMIWKETSNLLDKLSS